MTARQHRCGRAGWASAGAGAPAGRVHRCRGGCWGRDRDRGSLMLYMVPVALVLLLFAGLVLDGGTALAARGRAADLAAQAARAGADQVSRASLRTGDPQQLRIDPEAARVAGLQVLRAGGASGTVTVEAPDVVRVSARVPARTAILSVVGIRDASGTASASATILHGVTTAAVGP